MFKTIFSKLITIFIVIIVIAFSITGLMLRYFLDSYFTDERASLLKGTSTEVNSILSNYLENIDYSDSFNRIFMENYLSNSLELLGSYTSSYIWIVDESGRLLRSNMPSAIVDRYSEGKEGMKIPESNQFSRLIAGETDYKEIGDFGGFFRDPYFNYIGAGDLWLTYGRSFKYQDPDGKDVMIVIYLHTPVNGLKQTRLAIFKYFFIAVGVAVVISFILVYIFSLRFTRPLKQIKNAAAKISSGDFKKRLNIKTRDEVGELAGTFNQMAAALQNLEEMRRGFVANVSHELRTPMTSIRGFIEGILDGTIPPERQNHYLTIVRDETNRLNRLVNDLLDLAKMEAGETTLNIITLDINEVIRKCVIKLETLFLEKELTVDADFEEEDIPVKADADAIERVLYNLLHNAIKFTPSGGNIKIMTRIQKDRVEVTVKDNGSGIDESELDMIWDRFYKTDKSRSRDKTGTGLGLAIVRNIINEHGQNIWVESKPGEGTSFTFTLARSYEEAGTQ